MRYLDPTTWNRAPLSELFGKLDWPFYSITLRVDVTSLYGWSKEAHLSFYYAFIHACMEAMNSVSPFLYKLRGNQVVLHDYLSPSFTVAASDDLFKIVTLDWRPGESVFAFCKRADEAVRNQAGLVPDSASEDRDDLVYLSCLPWLDFTSLTNERSLKRDDSIPRLSWGKFSLSDGRRTMPFCVDVNHRLIDGKHIGQFYEALQTTLERQCPAPYETKERSL
jgi:chloramphenicol O-acetyltransferase type A